jgi:hypothetical protein
MRECRATQRTVRTGRVLKTVVRRTRDDAGFSFEERAHWHAPLCYEKIAHPAHAVDVIEVHLRAEFQARETEEGGQ